MHDATPDLALLVRASRELREQADLLANAFDGRTCAIVTCGPSLKELPVQRFRDAVRGVPVVAVKQAIEAVGEHADFHCWNSFNVSKFDWQSSSTIRCLIDSTRGRIPQWNPFDLRFPQLEGHGELRNSLAWSRAFDEHRISREIVRPFGPGIMYELVIYLAVHLGCTRLITFGWDIADGVGRNTHFYDTSPERAFFERGRVAVSGQGRPQIRYRQWVPEAARYQARLLQTRKAHRRGARYNLTAALNGEPELVADSTGDLAKWLASFGVELKVVTESPHLRPEIPRIGLDQALLELRDAGSTGR